VASIVEGKEFKCNNHGDTEFITTDIEEWFEHLKTEPDKHVRSGVSVCVVCKEQVELVNYPESEPVLCSKHGGPK
jgi:hypothetical protein